MSKLTEYLKNLKKADVLVVGDIILDHYIWGKVNRISPEAPVPVVFVTRENFVPGGASNVAVNISSLKGQVHLCGVVGEDSYGEVLLNILKERDVNTAGIVKDKIRHTTLKTRVIAGHQHLVRIDREEPFDAVGASIKRIKDFIRANKNRFNVVILSDYAKGLITRELVNFIKKELKNAFFIADPKVKNEYLYKELHLITPNRKEAFEIAKMVDDGSEKTLILAAKKIIKELKLPNLLITRGEEGMSLFVNDSHIRIPTFAQEVFDVSGAGDTVVALVAAGLSSGLDLIKSCIIANVAASVVVAKMGTATASTDEIEKKWSLMDRKIKKELERYL